jgi:hypothetical protein
MIGGTKGRTGGVPSSGYEGDNTGAAVGEESMRLRQKMNGHSKSMSNAHGGP